MPQQLLGAEWVFMGFTRGQYLTQLIHLDPLSGRVSLADCDEASFNADCDNKQLSCTPLPLQNDTLPGKPGSIHEPVYLMSEEKSRKHNTGTSRLVCTGSKTRGHRGRESGAHGHGTMFK